MRQALARSELSKAELGRRIDVAPQQITKWFRDGGPIPQTLQMVGLAEALDVSIGWLVSGIGNPDPIQPWIGAGGLARGMILGSLEMAALTAIEAGEEDPVQVAYEKTDRFLRERREREEGEDGEWQAWELIRRSAIVTRQYTPPPDMNGDAAREAEVANGGA